MQNKTLCPMDPSQQFCPNAMCSASGQINQGNITIHDRKRERYRCNVCRRTFTARTGTMLEGLRKPAELVIIVVGLLAYGCPLQAIVHVFGLDEQTKQWQPGGIGQDSSAKEFSERLWSKVSSP